MRLGFISDTHGSIAGWRKAYQYFKGVDAILHAGDILYHGPKNPFPQEYNPKALIEALNALDIPLLVARGNCDSPVDDMVLSVPILSPYLFTYLQGYRIMMNHGDSLDEAEAISWIETYQLKIFLTGHTHIPVIKRIGNGFLLNPGSPALSKYQGIQTIGLLEEDGVLIKNIDTGEILMEESL